jgi:uncharacterized protein (TIGR02266 family)
VVDTPVVEASSDGPKPDRSALIREFLGLNRRRMRGDPPLGVAELERWMTLRKELETALGSVPDQAGAARRRALRVPTHLKVRCSHESHDEISFVKEISEGGIFLATPHPPAPGTPLHLQLEGLDDDEEALEVEGVVVWTREASSENGPAGMGIRFTHLDEVQREAVACLVEHALRSL